MAWQDISSAGWRAVVVPSNYGGPGYHPDLVRDEIMQYKRHDGEPFEMRLSEQSGYFNIAGLYFRPLPAPPISAERE